MAITGSLRKPVDNSSKLVAIPPQGRLAGQDQAGTSQGAAMNGSFEARETWMGAARGPSYGREALVVIPACTHRVYS